MITPSGGHEGLHLQIEGFQREKPPLHLPRREKKKVERENVFAVWQLICKEDWHLVMSRC